MIKAEDIIWIKSYKIEFPGCGYHETWHVIHTSVGTKDFYGNLSQLWEKLK